MNLPSTKKIEVYFRWEAISDPDDNKFVDCAVAANAQCLVSHDKHFNILKTLDFPKVNVIDVEQFRLYLEAENNFREGRN